MAAGSIQMTAPRTIRSSTNIGDLAAQQTAGPDSVPAIYGTVIFNPGDGEYQIWPGTAQKTAFQTITIVTPRNDTHVHGHLDFSMGAYHAEIDLAANARFLSLIGPIPFLWVHITGTERNDRWIMVLS